MEKFKLSKLLLIPLAFTGYITLIPTASAYSTISYQVSESFGSGYGNGYNVAPPPSYMYGGNWVDQQAVHDANVARMQHQEDVHAYNVARMEHQQDVHAYNVARYNQQHHYFW